jgi:hypothetical protein
MGFRARFIVLSVFASVFCQLGVLGQTGTVSIPTNYHAVENRAVYNEPAVPTLGAAGYRFSDPAFGSRILRVTDGNTDTRGGSFTNGSYSTPSAAHQLAWNATSDRFYVRSISGWFFVFNFDATTMTASRVTLPTNGGLVATHIEPQFSFRSGNILYAGTRDQTSTELCGTGSDTHSCDYPVIHQYDFSTNAYTVLLNLRLRTTVPPDTYVGAISSSATDPEKVAAMFGGHQDSNFKVAVFQPSAPDATLTVLDTKASRLDGKPVTMTNGQALDFYLHHAWIDLSGRYVVLYPVAASPVAFVVWDLSTGQIRPVPLSARTFGHDALGYGWQVNQDCCTSGAAYDGAQWQLRSLASPDTTTDLIAPMPSPREIYVADHTSWNNAQSDRLVPILSSIYRYHNGTHNTTPWRAWDDEIVAIQTDAGTAGATVWRFAHHRSNISRDDGIDGTYFWYQPHGVISPNGRWALFTSNWEKSLGLAANPEPSGRFRTDVFIVGLTAGSFTDDPLISGVTRVKALHIAELRTRIDVLRASHGLSTFGWTDPALGVGYIIKAAHVTDMRTALSQAYTAAGRTPPPFTDSITPGATPIRAVHIQELRNAVVALEGG